MLSSSYSQSFIHIDIFFRNVLKSGGTHYKSYQHDSWILIRLQNVPKKKKKKSDWAFYSHYIYNFVVLYFLHEMQIMNNKSFFFFDILYCPYTKNILKCGILRNVLQLCYTSEFIHPFICSISLELVVNTSFQVFKFYLFFPPVIAWELCIGKSPHRT